MYEADSTGICPHCRTAAKFIKPTNQFPGRPVNWFITTEMVASSEKETIFVDSSMCPACHKVIVFLRRYDTYANLLAENLVYPMNATRLVPTEVPPYIGNDFVQAASVLPISEKASAALSRRCLQNVLSDNGFKKKDLNDQIEDALPTLPTRIAENLDAIRNIGNFAAHPLKHQSTGLIVDVEPEEANWNLDVLEQLFDLYYVQPKKAAEKRKKLDEKLKDLGKPPMKKA
jgi:hypothetical protein